MRPYVHKSRKGLYLRFNLSGRKFMAHKLVGEYFVLGRSAERNQLNHKDGNTLNPMASNLEWCTQSENIKHSYALRNIKTLISEIEKKHSR